MVDKCGPFGLILTKIKYFIKFIIFQEKIFLLSVIHYSKSVGLIIKIEERIAILKKIWNSVAFITTDIQRIYKLLYFCLDSYHVLFIVKVVKTTLMNPFLPKSMI